MPEMEDLRNGRKAEISPTVFVLVVVFGSCSWLSVNSVFLELPLMVKELPEGWNLPSYLAVIVQLGIIGPLLYGLFKKIYTRPYEPSFCIVALLFFGCVCSLLLVFWWGKEFFVFGRSHSVFLFLLFFLLSIVNCTSSVLFLPYMAFYKPPYLTAYFIGMGFSGFVPSIVALIQGAGRVDCINDTMSEKVIPPNFSVSTFNAVMFLWMCFGLIAFCLLTWTESGKKERISEETEVNDDGPETDMQAERSTSSNSTEECEETETKILNAGLTLPWSVYLLVLFLTAWICALMNGILPSIQTFSCLPYGQTTYHFSVVFSSIANPLACFIPYFLHLKKPVLTAGLVAVIGSVVSGYPIFLAASSPHTPFTNSAVGSILCILGWIVSIGFLAYFRTVAAGILREASGDKQLRLFWCGMFTQAGSFFGAIVMFPLINILQLFHQVKQCQ